MAGDGRGAGGAGPAERIRELVARASGPGRELTPAEAVRRARWGDVASLLHARLAGGGGGLTLLAVGVPASPGVASGRVVTSAAAAVEAAARGEPAILVRAETSPDDVVGMRSASGVLTARGGVASHAAVVARGWGVPAVVGASEVRVAGPDAVIAGWPVPEGSWLSLDGGTGQVWLGAAEVAEAEPPAELEVLLGWADEVRAGRVEVRANADDADEVAAALARGAQGIGLCRTEHQFLRPDRLGLVQRFIVADDPEGERRALAALEAVQQADLAAVLAAAAGAPVTVRLLDPPLHEFLPDVGELAVAEAAGALDDAGRALLAAARRLRQANPMLGTRGVRLGVVRPGLYRMQLRALCRAAAATGGVGEVEVLVPLVVGGAEVVAVRRWLDEAVAEVRAEGGTVPPVRLGAMVETPRAAVLAGEVAEVAELVSFGTNDLTQLAFGFSRDDAEAGFLPRYLADGLVGANPFEELDVEGVGRLVGWAVAEARRARPGCPVGVCGEHAGDPASARFLVACGVSYVSCSPLRVPVARLALAQAVLAEAADGDPAAPAPGGAVPDGAVRAGGVPDGAGAVLHGLRVRGLSDPEGLAEAIGEEPGAVRAALDGLVAGGLARAIEGRGLWQLTPAGRQLHAATDPWPEGSGRAGLALAYEGFLPVNGDLKVLCTAWQVREGRPNDHADVAYDRARLAELAELHRRAEPVLAGLAGALPRLDRYRRRLAAAAGRVAQGDHRAFTGVGCGSYHEVWMELHEDLLLLLGIDREVEGSH